MTDIRKVSYSQYSLWSNCPLSWKLRYIDKFREPTGIALIFGTACHNTIQGWLDLLYTDKQAAKVFNLQHDLKEKLIEEFNKYVLMDLKGKKIFPCDQATLTAYYREGCAIMAYLREHYIEYFHESPFELVGCEIPLNVPLTDGISFIGYIDIILRNKNTKHIYIYDLKTSKRGWWSEKKDPKKLNQLLLYKLYYARELNVDIENIHVEFLILKRQIDENSQWTQRIIRFEPPSGPKKIREAEDAMMTFVNTAFEPDGTPKMDSFVPTPSQDSCKWCYFKNKKDLCPVGIE